MFFGHAFSMTGMTFFLGNPINNYAINLRQKEILTFDSQREAQ
jgi:hypothetical protein